MVRILDFILRRKQEDLRRYTLKRLKDYSGSCLKKRNYRKARMDERRADKMTEPIGEMMVLGTNVVVVKMG